jgi:hypothetical protein
VPPAALCHRLLNLEQDDEGGRQAAEAYLRRVHAHASAEEAGWLAD